MVSLAKHNRFVESKGLLSVQTYTVDRANSAKNAIIRLHKQLGLDKAL